MRIHVLEPEGDVLVFLTGQEEIEAMVRALGDLCGVGVCMCTAQAKRVYCWLAYSKQQGSVLRPLYIYSYLEPPNGRSLERRRRSCCASACVARARS